MQCSMVFCSTPRSALKFSKQTMTLQRFARASKARLLLYKKECRISFWGLPIFSFLYFLLRHPDTLTLCVDNKPPLVPLDGFIHLSATMPHSTSPRAPPTSPGEPWYEEEFCSSIPTIPLQAILNCAACIPTFATHTQCVCRHAQTNQQAHTSLARTLDVHISHTTNGKYIPH
jgi:hypothetical protein